LIRLEKGVRYYIETVHKESTGADHMSVSWQIPGGAFEGPIPGSRLSPWTNSAAPLAGRVTGARAFAAGIESNTIVKALQVTATPNPSTNYFSLSIKSNSNKSVNITVLDAAGRVVETNKNAAANSTLQIGSKLIPGIYFIEVLQDNQKQRIKLVKQ
jgi:endoglucanase